MTAHDAFYLDRAVVRASFDRASATYDEAAVLQSRVADELLARVDTFNLRPRVVLDLGAGTARSTAALKRKFRRSLVVALDLAPRMLIEARRYQRLFHRFERICADATRLPFGDNTVDIVFSSLMLQWCDLYDAFREVRRVLTPDGLFVFSTFGPDTLKELRAAWAQADGYNHVNHFLDMHDVGDALVRAGMSEPVLDVDRLQLTYPDATALMRDLKAIGAHNVTAGRSRGLTGKSRMQQMRGAYEQFRLEGRLPATYEIVYGTAWGAAGRAGVRTATDGEVRIAADSIRRRGPR
jgi:malonyl-CoA O-methyltransferase